MMTVYMLLIELLSLFIAYEWFNRTLSTFTIYYRFYFLRFDVSPTGIDMLVFRSQSEVHEINSFPYSDDHQDSIEESKYPKVTKAHDNSVQIDITLS